MYNLLDINRENLYLYFLFELRFIGYLLILSGFFALIFYCRKRHFFFILIYLELILLGLSILFITTSLIFNDSRGLIMVFVILVLAAVETSIGLALFINYFYTYQNKKKNYINNNNNEYNIYLRKKQG